MISNKETKLYYLNARMYDPKVARFLQEDTYLGTSNDPLSLNLYTYCVNNPLMYSDPTGHTPVFDQRNGKMVMSDTPRYEDSEPESGWFNPIKKAAGGIYNAGKRVVGYTIDGAKQIYNNPSIGLDTISFFVNNREEFTNMFNQELVKPIITKDLGIREDSSTYKALKYAGVRTEAAVIISVNLRKGIVGGIALAGETVVADLNFGMVEASRTLGLFGFDNDLVYQYAHDEALSRVNKVVGQWMSIPGSINEGMKITFNGDNARNFFFNPDLSLHDTVEYGQALVNTGMIIVPAAKVIDAGLKAGITGINASAAALANRTGLQPATVGGYGSNLLGNSAINSAINTAGTTWGSNILYASTNTGVGGGKKLFQNQQPQKLSAELDLANKLGVKPLSPSDPGFESMANSGRVKWVVTEGGDLLVIPHSVKGAEISHAVISKGKPVIAAGEADIAMFNGEVFGLDITTNSGHFLYGADAATNAIVKNIGIDSFAKFGIVFK